MRSGPVQGGQVPLCVTVFEKFRYLIMHCQEVVVDPEGKYAHHTQLDFGRLAIS